MKGHSWLVAAIVILSALSLPPAFGQANAPHLGRGGAGIAITNEDATGIVNPAGLSRLIGQPRDDTDDWFLEAGYSNDTNADHSFWIAQASTRRMDSDWGLAVGQLGIAFGDKPRYVSFGDALNDRCSWGVTVTRYKPLGEESTLTFDIGLLHTLGRVNLFGQEGTLNIGVVAKDVSDEFGNFFNAGLGLDLGRLRIAADVIDFTEEFEDGATFNVGAEYKLCKYFTARVGSLDGDLTWGVGLSCYRLSVDYAEQDLEGPGDNFGLWTARYTYSW